jgi:hypothetical protein
MIYLTAALTVILGVHLLQNEAVIRQLRECFHVRSQCRVRDIKRLTLRPFLGMIVNTISTARS